MLRGEDWSGEFEMPDRRGRGSHWILAFFFVLKDAGGAPQYFANTVTDLTQRRIREVMSPHPRTVRADELAVDVLAI